MRISSIQGQIKGDSLGGAKLPKNALNQAIFSTRGHLRPDRFRAIKELITLYGKELVREKLSEKIARDQSRFIGSKKYKNPEIYALLAELDSESPDSLAPVEPSTKLAWGPAIETVNFKERLEKSDALVIGCSYDHSDHKRFSPNHPHYIGVGTEYGQQINMPDNPLNGRWEDSGFWPSLSEKLGSKKFPTIIIDRGTMQHLVGAENGKLSTKVERKKVSSITPKSCVDWKQRKENWEKAVNGIELTGFICVEKIKETKEEKITSNLAIPDESFKFLDYILEAAAPNCEFYIPKNVFEGSSWFVDLSWFPLSGVHTPQYMNAVLKIEAAKFEHAGEISKYGDTFVMFKR